MWVSTLSTAIFITLLGGEGVLPGAQCTNINPSTPSSFVALELLALAVFQTMGNVFPWFIKGVTDLKLNQKWLHNCLLGISTVESNNMGLVSLNGTGRMSTRN